MSTLEQQSAGRAVRSIALHSLVAAVLYLSPLGLLGFFVPAVFLHAGLRTGIRGLWGSIVGGTFLVAAITMTGISLAAPGAINEGVTSVLRFVVEMGVPSAVMMLLVYRGASSGQTLLGGLASSVAGFWAAEAALRSTLHYSPYAAVVDGFRMVSGESIRIYRDAHWPEESIRLMSRASEIVSSTFMPFVLIAVSTMIFLVSILALSRFPAAREIGPRYLFRYLAFPEPMLFLFVLAGLSPLAGGVVRTTGLNLLAAVAFLYLLQGLAVFRYVVLRLGFGMGGNLIAWGLLTILLLYGIGALALFAVGLFDPFFDFRKLNRKDDSDESHTG